jgi:hypothetical protein
MEAIMVNALFVFVFFVTACVFQNAAAETAAAKPYACNFFTYANAEKLLGQKLTAADSDEMAENGSRRWGCTFSTTAGESGPRLFFLLIKDASEEAARAEFEKVRASNKKHAGFEEWPEVGDEAVVHTDGQNFQFLMARKGANTIRVKVANSKDVSLDELKAVTALLTAKLK